MPNHRERPRVLLLARKVITLIIRVSHYILPPQQGSPEQVKGQLFLNSLCQKEPCRCISIRATINRRTNHPKVLRPNPNPCPSAAMSSTEVQGVRHGNVQDCPTS